MTPDPDGRPTHLATDGPYCEVCGADHEPACEITAPCPECGNPWALFVTGPPASLEDTGDGYAVCCSRCSLTGPRYATAVAAIARWDNLFLCAEPSEGQRVFEVAIVDYDSHMSMGTFSTGAAAEEYAEDLRRDADPTGSVVVYEHFLDQPRRSLAGCFVGEYDMQGGTVHPPTYGAYVSPDKWKDGHFWDDGSGYRITGLTPEEVRERARLAQPQPEEPAA